MLSVDKSLGEVDSTGSRGRGSRLLRQPFYWEQDNLLELRRAIPESPKLGRLLRPRSKLER